MPYSSVGTPVFYIDDFMYRKTIGKNNIKYFGGTGQASWTNVWSSDGVPQTTPQTLMDIFTMQPILAKNIPSQSISINDYYNSDYEYSGDVGFQRAVVHIPFESMEDFDQEGAATYNTAFNLTDGNIKGYCAILNHNLTSIFPCISAHQAVDSAIIAASEEWHLTANIDEAINFRNVFSSSIGAYSYFDYGSTIFTFESNFPYRGNNLQLRLYSKGLDEGVSMKIGAISAGIQYTMPKSPNLDVTMEIVYDGVDTLTTTGGRSISNVRYKGAPHWSSSGWDTFEDTYYNYNLMPFDHVRKWDEVPSMWDSYNLGISRNGRRTWTLNFSHVSDFDLFSSNAGTGTLSWNNDNMDSYEEEDVYNAFDTPYSEEFAYNIDTDDSFYAQVWNKTLGGTLPFIFQPDSSNKNEFFMCKFDQDSLKISQSAYRVYDFSVKITEVW